MPTAPAAAPKRWLTTLAHAASLLAGAVTMGFGAWQTIQASSAGIVNAPASGLLASGALVVAGSLQSWHWGQVALAKAPGALQAIQVGLQDAKPFLGLLPESWQGLANLAEEDVPQVISALQKLAKANAPKPPAAAAS